MGRDSTAFCVLAVVVIISMLFGTITAIYTLGYETAQTKYLEAPLFFHTCALRDAHRKGWNIDILEETK